MCFIIEPNYLHLLYYLYHTFVIVVHIIWETKKIPIKSSDSSDASHLHKMESSRWYSG